MSISHRLAGAVASVVLLLPTGASAAPAALPPLDFLQLNAAIDGLPDGKVSGAVVQVRGTAGCWQGTGGIADRDTGAPVPQDARFRIGSMTKTFTAVVVLQLAAEGRISLDGTVQQYLPDLLPAGTAPITIRQMLTYTSGVNGAGIDSKDADWYLEHRYDHYPPGSQLDTAAPLAFAPGTKQRYGNADYIVAGLLVERVTGRSWADNVRHRIIAPLGLRATEVPEEERTIRGPHARGYEIRPDGTWEDITDADTSLQWSAASIISNAPDLDRFLVALFTGRLVRQPYLNEMFTVPDVPLADGSGRAVHAAGLTRIALGPLVVWGKSGDRPGYNNGMGATRDLARRLVYSVNPLNMGGTSQPAAAQRIIMATFAGAPATGG
ncbi:peptidase [Virgisporangium aliadipatigenens]|uniref:Peptidase n=1 Tax=Virgisporangium aliadipatigenens TaxID=741659 RepID=A0A8J4DLW0_9ACTN|nr:serine hydrolase domain-containing protein [Virgisporangium aliadipatigenens]GIJ43135.1 peptidase [Virgisporangium aliadipatigenens]